MMISVPGDRSVAAEIEGLNHRLKIPKGLRTLGVPPDKLPWVIDERSRTTAT
jgi:alcohol dehydrogenase class IV